MTLQTTSTSRDAFFVAGGVVPLLLVWAVACFFVPRFTGLFADLGVQLPWATRWLMASYRYGFAMVAVVAAVWAWWPLRSSRGVAALVVGVTCAAALSVWALIALYLPIYRLGAGAG